MKKVNLYSLMSGLSPGERLKIYRKVWYEAGRYEILTDYPLHLDVELAGVCNLKCEFCFQNGLIKDPLGYMDFEIFKKTIDEGRQKGLCAVKLQVRGESFLHPKLFDCIRYAKDAGVVDVQITTNGTIMDDKRIQNILDSGLDGIIFSVDGQHNDSYREKYKAQDSLSIEQAINNLLYLRDKHKKLHPWVRVQTSIVNGNAGSIRKIENELINKFKLADIVIVSKVHDFRENVEAYPDFHDNYKILPCNYLMQRLTIFWNGDVTTCCSDYNNRFKLGNVRYQTVEEIWNSEKMENLRKRHNSGLRKEISMCSNCPVNIAPVFEGELAENKILNYVDHECKAPPLLEIFKQKRYENNKIR
ncbi:MAG TPA: radical SAM protein [bacterium]|nr:radical SAM protein [bacterium]